MAPSDFTFSVAPMMDRTDRHCRYLHRLISRRTRLYTEMVVAQALHHAPDVSRWLAKDSSEHPVAFQVGGADPELLASATRKVAAAGYDEINLNVGCPSERVSSGRFGACLMAEPDLVARCVAAMQAAAPIKVTVKTRIGIDEDAGDQRLDELMAAVEAVGCDTIVVHARNAILKGLSPKENREIPPLRYDRVYRLKQQKPHLTVIINGGIATLADTQNHLRHVDGVMIGRAAYERPFEVLAAVDRVLFGEPREVSESDVALEYLAYAERQIAGGVRPQAVLRHAVNLFRQRPGAKAWRQLIAMNAGDAEVIDRLRALIGSAAWSEALAA
jgi:tRNA-dihydrouridine synthase A